MGYRHTNNLHADQRILLFKQCYAMEKIHGTSAHVSYSDGQVHLSSGGEKHSKFAALFDVAKLLAEFQAMGHEKVVIYGEAYGGSQQRMGETYGPNLCFTAFEVTIGDVWLDVPTAERVVTRMGLEFVPYKIVDTSIESLEAARDADSEIAIRRGMGPGKKMEGVVLRPLIEVTTNNDERIVAKFKRSDFEERKSKPAVPVNAEKQLLIIEAEQVAEEFVVPMRLEHVLQHLTVDGVEPGMEQMRTIIEAMVEDVNREGAGEFTPSKEVDRAIGKKTAILMKKWCADKLKVE